MKIAALRLHNVKRFAGVGVAIEGIGDGVNVLCAANEFGKSTSFEALHALFFQPHSSTSGEVRNLRPYSGGNPLVEADIATEAGRFRIAKQFYGGRSARVTDLSNGRLVAQADEAEDFIAGLVRGGTAGPAGLLWVRQGITGIEKRSRTEEDNEKQVRTSLLESVQGEVEAITGGRRMADIMAATEEALQRLVTPTGRTKVGERYAEAIDDRDRLEAEERKLAADVAALREALDRRTASARHLADLDRDEDRQTRRQAIAAAETAFDAAKAQRETLRAAEAELRLARDRRDTAARELATFRDALRRSDLVRDRLAEAEARRAAALERRRTTAAAVAAARTEADAAERREQEARDRLARLDVAMRAREAADRLEELETRLRAAEAARAGHEQAEAELALLVVPSGIIAELEELDVTIARLRAVAEAGRPSVEIVYDDGASATVLLDGLPMRGGQPQVYDGQALLALPGIGTITLRSGQPARTGDGLRQAEAKRAALLGKLGLDDLGAVRRRQVEAERKRGEVHALNGRLSLLAPDGLPSLRETVAAARAVGGDRLELKEDPAQLRVLHATAEAQRAAARQAVREAEPARTIADEDFVKAETGLASIIGERAHADAVAGPDETRAQREAALIADLARLDAALAEREAAVVARKAEAVDLAAAEAALRRVRSVSDAVEKDIARLREEIAGLNARIAAQADLAVEERWRETIDALDAARERASAYEREVAILLRLRAALEAARSSARETFLGPVMAELRPLLGMLFADDVSITFDDRTLLPHKILRRGQEEEVERLSGGMREQLSVLTRLAFARLLAKDGRPAPVILDDALVYSDDDRIEKMFNALHRQARDQQIIVFSCRQRAFRELGGTVLQMSDWHPQR